MDWLKSPKLMVGIFVTLTVVVVTLLLIFIPRHQEAGLLRVCWSGDTAYYLSRIEDGRSSRAIECQGQEDLVWPREQIPLSVAPSSSVEASDVADARRAIGAAVDLINSQVGFQLLVVASDAEAPDISVEWNSPYEVGEPSGYSAGWCSHEREGGLHSRVGVRALGSYHLQHRVLVHELGHAVGLDHDSFEASVMFPTTRDDSLDDRMSFILLTDHDRELLQRLYR